MYICICVYIYIYIYIYICVCLHKRAQNNETYNFILMLTTSKKNIKFCIYTRCISMKYGFQSTDGTPHQFVL